MNRRYRLKGYSDFRRVRRSGKSYAHPLLILIAAPNRMASARFGVMATRALGNAVRRNRAKRRLRAALAPYLDAVKPGNDLVLIARPALLNAPWQQVQAAVSMLLTRADCLRED